METGAAEFAVNWLGLVVAAFAGLGVLGSVFWLWMLVDCATTEPAGGNDKIVWVLIIQFTHAIGRATSSCGDHGGAQKPPARTANEERLSELGSADSTGIMEKLVPVKRDSPGPQRPVQNYRCCCRDN